MAPEIRSLYSRISFPPACPANQAVREQTESPDICHSELVSESVCCYDTITYGTLTAAYVICFSMLRQSETPGPQLPAVLSFYSAVFSFFQRFKPPDYHLRNPLLSAFICGSNPSLFKSQIKSQIKSHVSNIRYRFCSRFCLCICFCLRLET